MQRKCTRRYACGVALMLGWIGVASLALAAPLSISDVPLFLGFRVEPNVVLIVDDSGSMDWETMTQDAERDGRFTGTQPDGTNPSGTGPVRHRDYNDDGVIDCGFGTGGQLFYGYVYGVEFSTNTYTDDGRGCNTADDEEWRFRNYNFNPMYFNPRQIYRPWSGVDAGGTPYADMPITAAKDNPFNPASLTIDLTRHNSRWVSGTNDRATGDRNRDGRADGFRFYTWRDTNPNGLFDNSDERIEYRIRDITVDQARALSGDDTMTVARFQTNFANWFSYYRKRLYVTQAVYSDIIANSVGVRMGLVTLNNNNSGIKSGATTRVPVRSMNTDPLTGAKRTLMDGLFSMRANNGTPLRRTLRDVGQYLECNTSRTLFTTDCPALSVDAGGACQQNFAVLMTDGFENGSTPSVGNADGDRNTAFDGRAYADTVSETLADVAMYYYERDLQSGLANRVAITPGVDEASHQHMVTYTVTFSGARGHLTNDPPNKTDPFTWPSPFADNLGNIDDLRHAAFNGRGLFLSAANPAALADSLKAAFQDITERTSSAASVALNSGALQTNSAVYQARFNSGDWTGQLQAFPIQPDGSLGTRLWDAAVVLDGQDFNTGRTILTYNPSTRVGVPFRWGSLDATQQLVLNTNSVNTVDNQGQARLDYLRGSKAHEGAIPGRNNYRVRLHSLGDLINSTPFFVGAPPYPDTYGTGYAAFRDTWSNRTPMVMIGGNDGYLHVFHANTGRELLAYMPSTVVRNLSQLTSPTYQHRYYVDGSPTAQDVFITKNGTSAWRTVAVGGLRAGGQGIYALDITDPSTFSEGNAASTVLWEFSDANDPDMGLSYSQPSIVRMANGRWAVIIGNGFNSIVSDGRASTTGRAVLFILFIDGGLDGTWTLGTDYIKIDTFSGTPTNPNGLSTPAAVDLDNNFTVEHIVAGDLQGNLWTFDVRSTDPSQWRVAYTSGSTPQPLFTARDASNNVQPITTHPSVGAHPQGLGGYVVYFGTGKYFETTDNNLGTTRHSFYGVWDKVDGSSPPSGRSALLQQTVLSEPIVQGRTTRVTSSNTINWETQRGWYIDLPSSGERQVTDSVLRFKRIIFTTLIPNPDICSFGGTSFLMELDVNGGSRIGFPTFDLNADGQFNNSDSAPSGGGGGGGGSFVPVSGVRSDNGILASPTILDDPGTPGGAPPSELKLSSAADGSIQALREPPSGGAGRRAWRQLF